MLNDDTIEALRLLLFAIHDGVVLDMIEVGDVKNPFMPGKPMFNLNHNLDVYSRGIVASIDGWAKVAGIWPGYFDDANILDLVLLRPYGREDTTFWWLFGAHWSQYCPGPMDMLRRLDHWVLRGGQVKMADWTSIRHNAVPRPATAGRVGGIRLEELMAAEVKYRGQFPRRHES